MFRLWRCAVWSGHDGGNALKDEVTPTPPRLRTWPALEMTIVLNPSFGGIYHASIRQWTGNTADEVGAVSRQGH